jgi:peptidoglycan/xylan/chitin deacetylase (PgdA/CDA1 family)
MRLVLLSIIVSFSVILFSCQDKSLNTYYRGAIIRGDTTRQQIALVFTGDEYADGGNHIYQVLNSNDVKASFFFTGKFYRNPQNELLIKELISDGHYLGAHSDRHLLYCDWENRDSLLVDFKEFSADLDNNYLAMKEYGIDKEEAKYFLPPFEWYNDTISRWCGLKHVSLINYTPGTLSHADYTSPGMPNYRSSIEIYESITEYEADSARGLNGFILLMHIGTTPERTDKFHYLLSKLISELENKGYSFHRIDELL